MLRNYDALGYYEILGIRPDDDQELIKRQYYKQAKFWHPDHNEASDALEKFQKVAVAYDVLKNKETKLQYDLLSLIYNQHNFPPLGSLKIYKNQKNKDDPALRVLKQRRVKARGKNVEVSESKDVCNIKEAREMVFNTSLHNWLLGWWGKGAFRKNLAALKFNYGAVYVDDNDNLQLILHNALAYAQERNAEMAWIYAHQAMLLVADDAYAERLINEFIQTLDYHPKATVKLPYWSPSDLQFRQWFVPLILALLVLSAAVWALQKNGWLKFNLVPKQETFYEEREYAGGVVVPYDMVDAKLIKVEDEMNSLKYIYNFSADCLVYNGPDERYGVFGKAIKKQTVRVVAYTVNKAWYKIIIDSGETGFVRKQCLVKGMGNPVPNRSHVYQE